MPTVLGHVTYSKGIAYFENLHDALSIMRALPPTARVATYELGYAIQYRISGPYFPQLEDEEETTDIYRKMP
jgi:hypothetical protein